MKIMSRQFCILGLTQLHISVDLMCFYDYSLINLRSSHKSNFQLIVITHDEEFIDKLTKLHKVDYYFSVTRNDR